MSVTTTFTVPADQFPLGRLLAVGPGGRVGLDTMVPVSGSVIPYVRVADRDGDAIEARLEAADVVRRVERIDQDDDETLLRVDWDEDLGGLVDAIRRTDAVVLRAGCHGDSWSFRLRFPAAERLSEFYRAVVDDGISLELQAVNQSTTGTEDVWGCLTAEQRAALVTAFEAGYFDVPRETSLVDLSERLGISDSAVSQRLRRGIARLLAETRVREEAPKKS